MQPKQIKRISFVGLGLIGTSLMQALRKASGIAGRHIELIGYDPGFSADDVDCITGQLGLDRFDPEHARLFDADVIVLCAPVMANIALLEEVRRHAPQGALVTDVSSTKKIIAEKAASLGLDFIGMHPIAGREQQGYLAASPELLSGRLLIVCSGDNLPATGHAADLLGLLGSVGCIPAAMSPEEHDEVYANISHLPQLISTMLMLHCRENIASSGPGFASVSRLAGSSWPIWRDIVSTNSGNIADELDGYIARLTRLAAEVRGLKLDMLEEHFAEANRLYQSLQQGGRP